MNTIHKAIKAVPTNSCGLSWNVKVSKRYPLKHLLHEDPITIASLEELSIGLSDSIETEFCEHSAVRLESRI